VPGLHDDGARRQPVVEERDHLGAGEQRLEGTEILAADDDADVPGAGAVVGRRADRDGERLGRGGQDGEAVGDDLGAAARGRELVAQAGEAVAIDPGGRGYTAIDASRYVGSGLSPGRQRPTALAR
jgi:hypothetical protein